jgi:hypothetical protein
MMHGILGRAHIVGANSFAKALFQTMYMRRLYWLIRE